VSPEDAQPVLRDLLLRQARACGGLGSPLYAALLAEASADVMAGGPVWQVLRGHEADPPDSALALRLMGAVHRLVLEGRAPGLAVHYLSAGGLSVGGVDGARALDSAWLALRGVVEAHRDELCRLFERPVQTNEVGRCAALVGGFLLVARTSGLPLRVLEIGSSAGLNLRWDHYRYEAADAAWGDAASPVRFADVFRTAAPPFDTATRVVERAGCDLVPVDAGSAEGRLTLRSYLWPDQARRHALLAGALAVAARVPAPVERRDGPDWLAERLLRPTPGVATVVFHSIAMQYLTAAGRERIGAILAEAGSRATAAAPLARLGMEPGGDMADLTLTVWPGGGARLIARAGYHGRPVDWLGGGACAT